MFKSLTMARQVHGAASMHTGHRAEAESLPLGMDSSGLVRGVGVWEEGLGRVGVRWVRGWGLWLLPCQDCSILMLVLIPLHPCTQPY